jgi:hypothetical protein
MGAQGQQRSNTLLNYAAGCLAGGANITTGYPFDTGKFNVMSLKPMIYSWSYLASRTGLPVPI